MDTENPFRAMENASAPADRSAPQPPSRPMTPEPARADRERTDGTGDCPLPRPPEPDEGWMTVGAWMW